MFPPLPHIFSIYFPWSSQLLSSIFSSIGIPGTSMDFPWPARTIFFFTYHLGAFLGQRGARSCRSSSTCNSWAFYKICWAPGVPWTRKGPWLNGKSSILMFFYMFFHTWWFQMIFRLKGREKCGKIKYGYSMIMHDYYGFLGSQTWRFSALVQGEASLESVWIRRIWPPIMALTSHCFLTSEPLGLQRTE